MTASFFEYLGWVSLSRNLKESFNRTLKGAMHRRHQTVEIEHLLTALVDDPESAIVLNDLGVDRERLREELLARLDELPLGAISDQQTPQPSRELKKLMAKASDLADKDRDDHVDGGDVVRALIDFDGPAAARLLQVQVPGRAGAGKAKAPPQGVSAAIESARAGFASARSPEPQAAAPLGFDVDPIRASIEAIMARRRDAEQVLNQCEWYHLFKSLNQIEAGLEDAEQTHRAILLARAERELAERPRCRKAFLYVRHLDNELARLKGIVDIDWTDEFSPDEAVAELARLRQMPPEPMPETGDVFASFMSLAGEQAEIERQLSHVRMQETEVKALERQLASLDRSQGHRKERIEELETQLRSHGEHGRKRSSAIDELERFLRSEVMQSEERDRRIQELEAELAALRSSHAGVRSEASLLADELAAHKAQIGDRERLIGDLEMRLIGERETAGTHERQIEELRRLLVEEKGRAEDHGRQMAELQRILDEERGRASHHESLVRSLEGDLRARQEELQAREEQIRSLQEHLAHHESNASGREERLRFLEAELQGHEHRAMSREERLSFLEAELHGHENRAMTREEQLKRLRAELAEREQHARQKDDEVRGLEAGLATQEAEGQRQQHEINQLRAALAALEAHQQQQEAELHSEKLAMEQLIAEMQAMRERSEGLVEIVHGINEPYRISSDFAATSEGYVQIVGNRSIPIPVRPHHGDEE
jgi:hypothetical protein